MSAYDIPIRGHAPIDWKLLREQRDTLVELANPDHAEDNLPPEQRDAVRGVYHLLDAMLDSHDDVKVISTYNDGGQEVMSHAQAEAELLDAILSDYRDGRWGGVYAPAGADEDEEETGREYSVQITVRLVPDHDDDGSEPGYDQGTATRELYAAPSWVVMIEQLREWADELEQDHHHATVRGIVAGLRDVASDLESSEEVT